MLLPSAWIPFGAGSPWSLHWDLLLSQWRAPGPAGSWRDHVRIGGIAVLRRAFGGGNSPRFAEAGLGATVLDRKYVTPTRAFSSHFQFTEVIGIGRRFGTNRAHEVSVRYQHFSNAGIEKPNLGENFLRLRYAMRF